VFFLFFYFFIFLFFYFFIYFLFFIFYFFIVLFFYSFIFHFFVSKMGFLEIIHFLIIWKYISACITYPIKINNFNNNYKDSFENNLAYKICILYPMSLNILIFITLIFLCVKNYNDRYIKLSKNITTILSCVLLTGLFIVNFIITFEQTTYFIFQFITNISNYLNQIIYWIVFLK